MKIRKSFITNSSSASFVVQKKFLSPNQINRIKNVIMSDECDDLPWTIKEYPDRIEGETWMDNGYLQGLFHTELTNLYFAENNMDVPEGAEAFVRWREDVCMDPGDRPSWIIEE